MNDRRRQDRTKGIVYLDNGATSFPKPPQVAETMLRWLTGTGGSPGRSGHRLSTESARLVFETRESLAGLLGVSNSKQIIFTGNATGALNLAIQGVISPGDHVVTTSMEHNSVMRPLRHLAGEGTISLSVVECGMDGRLEAGKVAEALTAKTALVVSSHASNVTGTILPVTDIGRICRERGILYLVDAAQTAGALPIDVEEMNVDLLAFTGHKALLGPMGTGGLVIREGVDVRPLTRGGTGSNSEFEEQPGFLPDCLESGTPNAVGLVGLGAGVDFILATGVEKIRRDELKLTARLLEGLKKIPGLTIYGPSDLEDRTAVVSFTIDGLAPSEIGYILDEAFNIMVRVGLHCAPSSHRTISTFPGGTVRLVPGYFNTAEDIDFALDSLETISRRRAGS